MTGSIASMVGIATLVVTGLGLELAARRRTDMARAGEALISAMHTTVGRAAALACWVWVGVHFLAYGDMLLGDGHVPRSLLSNIAIPTLILAAEPARTRCNRRQRPPRKRCLPSTALSTARPTTSPRTHLPLCWSSSSTPDQSGLRHDQGQSDKAAPESARP